VTFVLCFSLDIGI